MQIATTYLFLSHKQKTVLKSGCLLVCIDALRSTQHFFIHVRMIPVFLGWTSAKQWIKCLAGHNTLALVSLKLATLWYPVQGSIDCATALSHILVLICNGAIFSTLIFFCQFFFGPLLLSSANMFLRTIWTQIQRRFILFAFLIKSSLKWTGQNILANT